MPTLQTKSADELRNRISGQVTTSADPEYDAARLAFNLTVDQRPAAVALPETDADVAAIVEFAREYGLRVAPQRTGHNAEPMADDLDLTILVKTDRMKDVAIDASARKARVGAGVKWEDVADRISDLGLCALWGSALDVGIVGYSLGGGLGFMSRKHGLQANAVTAIEIVTADAKLRRVDADNDPDLFWALRGGGGNFGVVTALEFDLLDEPEIYAGTLFFEFERAREVLQAWLAFTKRPDLPDEVTSVGRVMQFPPLEEVPEMVRGKSFAIIEVIYTGPDAEARGSALVDGLRDLGPVMDTLAMVPPAALGHIHMDPEDPMPYYGDGYLVDSALDAAAIDRLVDVAGPGSGSPLASVELRHTGGAVARRAEGAGAAAALPGEYLLFAVGGIMAPEDGPLVEAQTALVSDAVADHKAGLYLNFVERPQDDASSMFDAETYARLQRVRAMVDPEGMFRANHEIKIEAAA